MENGEQVRVIDNLSTGKKENLNKYLNEIESINGDLIDYEITRMAVTVNLLFACVRPNNVKRAVQAASSSAYGNTPLLPKIENMNPIPRSPYAASKL